MFFDDRLATVLRQRGESEIGARTQFRQLLDILGNRKFGPESRRDNSLIAAAWLRMDALAKEIPADHRAMMIRERGWRLRSADLTAHLADFEPEVASAALNRADLSAEEWTALIPQLPVRARGFLRLRRDLPVDAEALLDRLGVYDRGLPQPIAEAAIGEVDEPPVETAAEPEGDHDKQDEPEEDALDVLPAPVVIDWNKQPETPQTPPVVEPGVLPEPEPVADAEVADQEPEQSEISALVERIARFRRDRDTLDISGEFAPQLPLGEFLPATAKTIAAFGFSTDPQGRIEWAEGDAGPMAIGTKLIGQRDASNSFTAGSLERAILRRQPITQAPFELDGGDAIAGHWLINAQPQFSEAGNFTGYVGRFLRVEEAEPALSESQNDADRIRQLLHELRTPVTAVQGYAEVIQQQLFGPAPHEYRALAASIAADAARILAGFEELDRLAKLEAGAIDIAGGETDFGAIAADMVDQLQRVLSPRMAGFDFKRPADQALLVAIDAEDTEGLLWRVLATLAAGCAAGETLDCKLTADDISLKLDCALPAQLLSEEDIFAAEIKPMSGAVNTGLFGTGFALRLARAEAQAAGGRLSQDGEHLCLTLPHLTEQGALPSDRDQGLSKTGA